MTIDEAVALLDDQICPACQGPTAGAWQMTDLNHFTSWEECEQGHEWYTHSVMGQSIVDREKIAEQADLYGAPEIDG
jgi:hypothetical protein